MVLVALIGALALLGWAGQRRMLYFPSDVVPARAPAGVEEVVLSTSDGLDLDAWFVPTDRPPRSTVVVFHGNGGNRTGRLPLARRLAATGHEVLLVDYRGYGGNPGSPDDDGLARDAAAARDWVDARTDDGPPVVLLGESIGAAVAIESAGQQRPDALVLRSPFASLAAIARHHYRLVPSWFLRDRWPSLDRMGTLGDLPVLVVAGTADRIVPPDQSRRIHAAAGHGHMVVVDGADHNDRVLIDGKPLVDAVTAFLDDHMPADPRR